MTIHASDPVATLPERFRHAAGWLRDFAERTPGVVAAYVGGSLVNDRIDDDSDIDVNVATTAEDREAVFEGLLRGIGDDFEVLSRWVLPTPTAHGGLQVFAHVAEPDGELILDVVVDAAGPSLLDVDPRRHGPVLVLHDPGGRVVVRDGDDEALARDFEQAARRVADRLATAEWIVAKAIRRGHWPEAYAAHLRVGVEPVVMLLRGRHSPARWDFGLRYLDDLPDEERRRVLDLLPGDRDRLAGQVAEAFAWQRALLASLPPPSPPAPPPEL